MPLLITGHEDKHIRIFDIVTGSLLPLLMSAGTSVDHAFTT